MNLLRKFYDALRDSFFFREAIEAAGAGLWIWDSQHDQVRTSVRWRRILNLKRSQTPSTLSEYISLIHKDDRHEFEKSIRSENGSDGNPSRKHYRLKNGCGSYTWVQDNCRFLTHVNSISKVYGGIMDIRNYRQIEDRLTRFIDAVPSLVFVKRAVINELGKTRYEFTDVNNALVSAFCKENKSDLIGKADEDYLEDEKQIRFFFESDHDVSQGKITNYKGEEELTTPRGEKLILATLKVPLPRDDDSEAPADVLGVATDITTQTLEARSSDRLLNQIMGNMLDIIYVKDSKNNFLHLNKAGRDFTGYHDDVAGKTTKEVFGYDLLLAEELEKEESDLINSAKKGSEGYAITNFERQVRSRSGDIRYSLTDKRVIFDDQGRVEKLIVISRNITAVKHQQLLLWEMLDNLPQCIFRKDSDCGYTHANKSFLTRHSITKEELIGSTDKKLWRGERAESYVSEYERDDKWVMNNNSPILNKLEFEPFYAGDRQISTSKFPVHDENGLVIGILGVYEDVVETRRKLSVQIIEHLSHCMKGKMWPIDSSEKIVRDNFGTTEAGRFAADQIKTASTGIKRALGEAINIVALDTIPTEPIALFPLVESLFSEQTAQGLIDLEKPDVQCTVTAHRGQLCIVLEELLTNCKEANNNKLDLVISIRFTYTVGMCVLHFADNGRGIHKKLRNGRLFEHGQSTSGNSTGAGLYHAKKAMEAFGGDLLETSKEGEGAHFEFNFRLASCDKI